MADDRFELLEQIGSGGMGVVWKARDRESGQVVALKLLHAHLASDPDYAARLEREVEIARRIDSPHVVRVLGFGKRDGIPFMAMEYIDGPSLRDVIRAQGRLPWEAPAGSSSLSARTVARQVSEALAAAHAAGVIHRDVKPSNILITPAGQAKLADFGISRALDLTRMTGSATVLGTPAYMSPDPDATPASDVYSLGCVIFEMLAGAPPFEGDSQQRVILQHMRAPVDLTRVPAEGRPLLAALLAKEASERPAVAAILGWLDGGPVRQSLTTASQPLIRPSRRRPGLALAGGGILVLAGIGGTVCLASRGTSPTEQVAARGDGTVVAAAAGRTATWLVSPTATRAVLASPTDGASATSTPSVSASPTATPVPPTPTPPTRAASIAPAVPTPTPVPPTPTPTPRPPTPTPIPPTPTPVPPTPTPIPPAATPTPSGPPTLYSLKCQPSSAAINEKVVCLSDGTGYVTDLIWSAPGGTPNGDDSYSIWFETRYTTPGTKTITLRACNGPACSSISASVVVK